MRMILVLVPFICLALGCATYKEFVDYPGSDSASLTVTRTKDRYQTNVKIVNESELKQAGVQGMSCYKEGDKYWSHAESLGYWNDAPDLFEITLKIKPEKQYILAINWTLAFTCGGVYEFVAEPGEEYLLDIQGLYPSCNMSLRSLGGKDLKVVDIPKC